MQNANSFAIVDKRSRYKDPELAKRLVERIKDLRKTRNIAQETAIDQSRSDIDTKQVVKFLILCPFEKYASSITLVSVTFSIRMLSIILRKENKL